LPLLPDLGQQVPFGQVPCRIRILDGRLAASRPATLQATRGVEAGREMRAAAAGARERFACGAAAAGGTRRECACGAAAAAKTRRGGACGAAAAGEMCVLPLKSNSIWIILSFFIQ